MADKATIRAKAAELKAAFQSMGAQPVEADILQPAETLLDLYGEDIRGRAYVTSDPVRGEAMLRPDFTVPVVQMHMANGMGDARYTYAGEVFRMQEDLVARPSEYVQVGFEVFGGDDPAKSDAEVFLAFRDLLAPFGLRAATGDIGLLTAAVKCLSTTDRRKAALMRHIWRPRRFRSLMDRYGGARSGSPRGPFDPSIPEIGLRTRTEVEDRLKILTEDMAEAPIPKAEIAFLSDLLSLDDVASKVLSRLKDIVVDVPGMVEGVGRFARRLDALSTAGVDVDALPFEASYGRTSMEYYDGFVFGFYAQSRPDLPPVATGGRYDALTRVLGGGRTTPAVGGVVRPALLVELEGLA